jgi:hypothetical protein
MALLRRAVAGLTPFAALVEENVRLRAELRVATRERDGARAELAGRDDDQWSAEAQARAEGERAAQAARTARLVEVLAARAGRGGALADAAGKAVRDAG